MRRLDPAPEGATRGHGRVTAERSEISPDDRREESPKAMSIRGAERSEGIAEGEAREPSGGGVSAACEATAKKTEATRF